MPGRYENDFPGDAVTEQDGDGFFIGLDSRSEPENLAPGIVSVSENMRFNERKAVVRAGMEKQTNDISFSNLPLIIPFVLSTPAPIVRNSYSNGIFESCVWSDQTTNEEFIAVATAEAAFLFRPGESVVEIDYPANELITGADQVDMFQVAGSLYILRGMSTATAGVTSITRAATTATVTTAANHGLVTGQYVRISGATQPEYNGTFQITVTGVDTFTYTVAGAPATPATTRTYITGSDIGPFTAGQLQVGTFIHWHLEISKTAAGTASATFDIAFGTAGSTSDTARITFTKPAGAAQIDNCSVDIWAQVKTNSASGVVLGDFTMNVDQTSGTLGGFLAATKFVSHPAIVTSGTFDTTTPTHVGLCVTTGASDAWTINKVETYTFNM